MPPLCKAVALQLRRWHDEAIRCKHLRRNCFYFNNSEPLPAGEVARLVRDGEGKDKSGSLPCFKPSLQ